MYCYWIQVLHTPLRFISIKKYTLFLLCLVFTTAVYSQGANRINLPDHVIGSLNETTICVDFGSPEVTYSGDDRIEIFPPGYLSIENCRIFSNCHSTLAAAEVESDIQLSDNSLASPAGKNIVCFQVLNGGLKPGKVEFQVLDRDNKIRHVRVLKIKGPKPAISAMQIRQEGQLSDSTIQLDFRDDLSLELVLEGGPFYEEPTIKLQGRPFTVKSRTLNRLEAELKIEAKALKDFKIGHQHIEVSNKDGETVRKAVFIKGLEPVLTKVNPIVYTNKVSQVSLQAEGFNFSPNAQLCIKCADPDHCYIEEGCFPLTEKDGNTLTADVIISLPDHVTYTKFYVTARNGDGTTGYYIQSSVIPAKTSAKIVEQDQNKPLIAGVTTEVVIKRESIGAPFETENESVYQLKVITSDPAAAILDIRQRPTPDQIRAFVTIPEHIYGNNIKFELSHGAKSWNGIFDKILRQPVLEEDQDVFRRNEDVSLAFLNRVEGAAISANYPGLEIIDGDISDRIGKVRLTEDLLEDTVELKVYVKDQFVYSKKVAVREWAEPTKTLSLANEKVGEGINSIISLQYGESLKIIPDKDFLNKNDAQRVYVQLYSKNGSALGDVHTVRFRKADTLEIYPQLYGLSYGDEFKVEFKTPDNQRALETGYIQRNFINRWKLNVGLNGIRYHLKDDGDTSTVRYSLLNGLNTGLFYLFGNDRPRDIRFFGAGLHAGFAENSAKTQLGLNWGISLLLAERLSLGLDFPKKDQPLVLTIGANVSVLDFTKLFVAPSGG